MTFEDIHSTAALPFVPWVMHQIDFTSVHSVADLGAGEGRFTIPLARELRRRGGTVYAVDRDADALGHLRRTAEREGLSGQIEPIQADIRHGEALPHNTIDVVMLNFVLHLIPGTEIEPCIIGAATSLHESGLLVITGYGNDHMPEPFDWLRTALGAVGVPYDRARKTSKYLAKQLEEERRHFTLDEAPSVLRRHFDNVVVIKFVDTLEASIEDTFRLVEGLASSRPVRRVVPDGRSFERVPQAFIEAMRSQATDGVLRMRADRGVVLASMPHQDS